MLPIIFGESRIILLAGIAAAFLCSFLGIRFGMSSLPRDGGRKFAVNGALSKGKPRGAGLIFVAAFTVCGVLFVPFTAENLIYILLVVGGMMSGYLDDASEKPWGEYKKGLIDLIIALAGSFTYVNFNGSTIRIPFTELSVTLPRWLYILLGVVLIWTAINVTNCSDGVDGLSGTLSMITIGSFCLLCLDVSPDFSFLCGIMIAVILAYQWFNASPSILMMGDAGYGLMMLVGIWAFKKLKKPRGDFGKLVNVLFFSSFTTIFWGIIFGSYFGETWHPILFAPLDNPMGMLVFCMIIGVLHIFSGMVMKMVEDAKAGHFWDGVFDQLSWMLLITGLGLLFLPVTRTVGMVLAIVGAAIILLTAGRAKKGIFGKLIGGLGGLYNITSYMSDILSYSRILALALASGVVGMVMNLLAGMVQGSVIGFIFSLLIYVVGHVFNLAMGLLSAYVHDSRLQYIEFFNKFYEGGGYAFRPLCIDPKYVEVVDNKDSN